MKRNQLLQLALIICLLAIPDKASSATVSLIHNKSLDYVDIFYTPSVGQEFASWHLTVTPSAGGLLDPFPALRSDDTTAAGGGAAIDTFVNTVFSSLGVGPAQHTFFEYNPGSSFPPPGVPADPPPSAGGSPDQLRWVTFDTARGDGAFPGLVPYHMARLLHTPRFAANIDVAFYEGDPKPAPGGTGSFATFDFPVVPEPCSFTLLGMTGIAVFLGSRRR